jgi:hypothetical protein
MKDKLIFIIYISVLSVEMFLSPFIYDWYLLKLDVEFIPFLPFMWVTFLVLGQVFIAFILGSKAFNIDDMI